MHGPGVRAGVAGKHQSSHAQRPFPAAAAVVYDPLRRTAAPGRGRRQASVSRACPRCGAGAGAGGCTMSSMSPQGQAVVLFLGVGVLLLVATFIGRVLAYYTGPAQRATIANLNARIATRWVMVLLIVIAFPFGKAR